MFTILCCVFFFFKQKTVYEIRISDWSSDVCSSDLVELPAIAELDRVESVCGDSVGAAAAGCAGPPPFEPGHARIRVVQVGRWPRRAVQRVDVGAVQLLAAELHAGAQVVPYP